MFSKKLLLSLFAIVLVYGFGHAQYYYFSPVSEFRQGCNEKLEIRVNTESASSGMTAGAVIVNMDDSNFTYETSSDYNDLQANLFTKSTEVFDKYFVTEMPEWWEDNQGTIYTGTKLIVEMNQTPGNSYLGSGGLFGFLKGLVPDYNVSQYDGTFSFEYDGSAYETYLSAGAGNAISATQSSFLSKNITVYQKPCNDDGEDPSVSLINPSGTDLVVNSGLSIWLRDDGDSGSTPYVFESSSWVNNTSNITNQYGIDSGSLFVNVNGNGHDIDLGYSDFVWSGEYKTWLDADRDYYITLTPSQLSGFGIEETITISIDVDDLAPIVNSDNFTSFVFNTPKDPVVSNRAPANGTEYVQLTNVDISFDITDNWAGVDTSSVVVTLSGINEAASGYKYIYSGASLSFSGISGVNPLTTTGNQAGYHVNILSHAEFPATGEIQVTVEGYDLKGNGNTSLSSWSFITRPDCDEIGCCEPIILQTGDIASQIIYSLNNLYISGGVNAYLDWAGGYTGYIRCNTENEGFSIYSGHGNNPGTASFISFEELNSLTFSGANVKVVLSGNNNDTFVLYKFGDFVIKAFPGSRSDQATNNSNIGEIRVYDLTWTNVLYSGTVNTDGSGTGFYVEDIPTDTYNVVYKGHSHLASYLSGVTITAGVDGFEFDFTTGANLYDVENLDSITDDGRRYQTAGDMDPNGDETYDGYINGSDVSVMLLAQYNQEVEPNHVSDLNQDGVFDIADIGIVGINYKKGDIYYRTNSLSW